MELIQSNFCFCFTQKLSNTKYSSEMAGYEKSFSKCFCEYNFMFKWHEIILTIKHLEMDFFKTNSVWKLALLTLGNYSLRSDLLLMNFLVLTGSFFLPEVCASCQWVAQCMITVYDHISHHCSSLSKPAGYSEHGSQTVLHTLAQYRVCRPHMLYLLP